MTTGNATDGRSVGVDIGGTKVLGVAIDHVGEVVAEARMPTPSALRGTAGTGRTGQVGHPPATVLADAVDQVVAALGRHVDGELGGAPVGVGLPGMVDGGGVLRFSPNLPGATGVDCVWSARRAVPWGGGGATTPTAPRWPSTASGPGGAATTSCW